MLKIHSGLKAIAIFMGPAAFIASYQSLSSLFSPPQPYDPQLITAISNVYQKCSELTDLRKTVVFDVYVKHADNFSHNGSDFRQDYNYKILVEIDLAPSSLRSAEKLL